MESQQKDVEFTPIPKEKLQEAGKKGAESRGEGGNNQ